MKVRFKFIKIGRLKYIGHLDLLNVWNRALKSARLPVSYSKGFNPHMLLAFAAPLPLGLESVSEYVDVDFESDIPVRELPERINAHFPEGLEITGVYSPALPYKRVASIVTRAQYRIRAPYSITGEQISGFLAQSKIEIMKKTKSTNEIADIRPDIFSVDAIGGNEISAVLSCGSERNLKPTLFIQSFGVFLEIETAPYKTNVFRTEIFGENGTGVTPLSEV